MKYKAVLFDMDGTILDTLADIANAVNVSLVEFGFPAADIDKVCEGTGNGARHIFEFCTPEGTPEETIDGMLRFYLPYYNSHCRIMTKPYDGILPLMQRLKAQGVKLAVVSNKPDSTVKELAREFFTDMLESAVGESDAVRRKPAPDTVIAAAQLMNVDIKDCVYVGDSEVDVATAANAGMDCIAVSWGFRKIEVLRAAGAEKIAGNATELEQMLK